MTEPEREIHADAREARARQCFSAIKRQERSDIAIAVILQAIDDWYEKGVVHGRLDAMRNKSVDI